MTARPVPVRARCGGPPGRTARGRRTAAAAALAAVLAAAPLAGCGAPTEPGSGAQPSATAEPPAATASPAEPDGSPHHAAGLPSQHVHGVAIDPADGTVHLATHEGLFRYDAGGPVRVGPVIDLMGFTSVEPGRFLASGHPGPGVDLPNPVGLLESTDGGETWVPVSRQGRTDFHALTASAAGVVGFDGAALLSAPDGRTWTELDVPVPVHSVAASPAGTTLLVTSEVGLARSADAGATWSVRTGTPLLQLVQLPDETTAVGVTPAGEVLLSEDAGVTWAPLGDVGGGPQALAAVRTTEGVLDVVVVTAAGLLRSRDGEPFAPFPAG